MLSKPEAISKLITVFFKYFVVMGNDIRDSTGTNEEHSSLKLSVYSTFISKLDKTDTDKTLSINLNF